MRRDTPEDGPESLALTSPAPSRNVKHYLLELRPLLNKYTGLLEQNC